MGDRARAQQKDMIAILFLLLDFLRPTYHVVVSIVAIPPPEPRLRRLPSPIKPMITNKIKSPSTIDVPCTAPFLRMAPSMTQFTIHVQSWFFTRLSARDFLATQFPPSQSSPLAVHNLPGFHPGYRCQRSVTKGG